MNHPAPSTPAQRNAELAEQLASLDLEPRLKTGAPMDGPRNPAQADDEPVAILGYN